LTSKTALQVYSGQELIGEIEDRGRSNVVAFRFEGAKRVRIGTFPTRIAAMRALSNPEGRERGA
jgi:hypothetical protein